RAQRTLTGARQLDPETPEVVFDLLIEYGDRTLDVAFRGGPKAERKVIDAATRTLTAATEAWAG
ncbi:MAG: hypothetical protein ACYDA6_10180, partial [Solirubrobacteraceae bacterium]